MKLANSLARIDNLIPKAPVEIKSDKSNLEGNQKTEGAGSFKDTLENLIANTSLQEAGFKNPLAAKDEAKNILKFSNHAVERMQSRGIMYDSERLSKLEDAVKKAAAKGSKDTLVLMDDSAAIVSVKNNTVVTVMDKNNLKENVFTNIDSTIVI
ncbi:MAG: TIGR02530 family flagellar biosynthesis protein [Pseudobdellovibrio sp.]